RLEGMKRAMVERERELGRLRAQEIELTRRKEYGDARAPALEWKILAALATVACAGLVAAYALSLAPRAEAQLADARAVSNASAGTLRDAQARLDGLAQRVEVLTVQLQASEERAQRLDGELRLAKDELDRKHGGAAPRAPRVAAPAPPPRDG